ncbi:MAG: energy-coupling factor transporter ATPase [Lachnospiraceae bacterium]|nr:energy-coupling factor transporter ATPase [Lachnospiraceae bacterium]
MSIKLEHLSHQYSQNSASSRYAIEDINLTIEKGEFIGLIGHTGSGKSTLIQHLNGLLKATGGSYTFDGEDVYAENYNMKKLRSKVGMSFQYPEHQLFEVTVLKDVCFGPMNMGLTEDEAIIESKKALEAVGLSEEYYEKSPFELSGGQKRRVAIAGVLAMNPEYFILDEPTAGLDPVGRDRILNLIYELHRERNMTIILVSHSMEDVARFAKRLLVMNQGHLMFDAPPVEVFRHKKELEEMGLSAPETSYVMEELHKRGFSVDLDAITMEQARDSILQAVKGGKAL